MNEGLRMLKSAELTLTKEQRMKMLVSTGTDYDIKQIERDQVLIEEIQECIFILEKECKDVK